MPTGRREVYYGGPCGGERREIVSPTVAGAMFDAAGRYSGTLALYTGTFIPAFAPFFLASRLPRPPGGGGGG